MVDYSQYERPPKDSVLQKLSIMGNALKAAQERVEGLTDQLAKAQKDVKNISETAIPDLMKEANMKSFTTSAGSRITIVDRVHAHISKERHAAAIKWLDENGHGTLATRIVSVEFGREQEKAATDLKESLSDNFSEVNQKVSVHASRLKKWVKEMMGAGEFVPVELFGIHTAKVAEIT